MRKRKLMGRLFCGVLSFATVFAMMSTSVLADEYEKGLVLKSDGAYWNDANDPTNKINDIEAEFGDKLKKNSDDNNWTMNDFNFTCTASQHAVQIIGGGTLMLEGENNITAATEAPNKNAIFSGSTTGVIITGSGSLSAKSNSAYAVVLYGPLTTENFTIEAGEDEANAEVVTGKGWQGNSYVKLTANQPQPEKPADPVDSVRPADQVIFDDYVAPAPSKTGNISGDTGVEVNVSVRVVDGSAVVSNIPMNTIEDIANSKSNGKNIVLDVSGTGPGTSQIGKTTLTKETMANIAEVLNSSDNNKEALVVKTDTSTVAIDTTALEAIVSQAGADNIQIVVADKAEARLNDSQKSAVAGISTSDGKEVVRAFEAYVTSGNTKITDFNGGSVTVGNIKIDTAGGKKAKNFHVYSISETGKLTPCTTWAKKGVLYFDMTSVSDYVLVYDENMKNGK